MKLTGVEVALDSVSKIQPNTVLIIAADKTGIVKVVQVDHDSIDRDQSLVKARANPLDTTLAGGCWVRVNGDLIWVNPCPY